VWILSFVGLDNYASSRLFAICFGPFGALLRWYLSLFNAKPYCKHFPFFTFLPNVSASILNCIFEIVVSIVKKDGESSHDAYLIYVENALMVGFLGSLSTVSSWIYELDNLAQQRYYWAYRYGIVSVVVAQLFSVFILGMFLLYGNAPLLI
jgi:fluoride ion exporter CrcB/FEX